MEPAASTQHVCSIYSRVLVKRGTLRYSLQHRRCASFCRSGGGPGRLYEHEPPLFCRLVNRNNCVQKLHGTLIVTWQANRIDTFLSAALPYADSTSARSSGRWLLSDFSPARIRPAKYVRPVSRSCSRRMHGARNELPRPVNYAPSLPIDNNVPRGLLIAGWIIRMLRRAGILSLPWTPY